MTSFTRKLYPHDPRTAVSIHRMTYGKHATLACFTLADRQDAEINVEFRSAFPHRQARIETDFDVSPALERCADRAYAKPRDNRQRLCAASCGRRVCRDGCKLLED